MHIWFLAWSEWNLMKPIFHKNLQCRDICSRNRQKIAQIDVFDHFLDFASLVFLDFAPTDSGHDV